MKPYNYIVHTNDIITQIQYMFSDMVWYDWLTSWMAVVADC